MIATDSITVYQVNVLPLQNEWQGLRLLPCSRAGGHAAGQPCRALCCSVLNGPVGLGPAMKPSICCAGSVGRAGLGR